MARPTTAARRFAEAAFELAARDDTHDRWAEDLRLASELTVDERVAAVVDNPAIPLVARERVLQRLLAKRISRPAFNLVRLLTHRARLELLPLISAEYQRLLDRERGVVAATVTSAAPLSSEQLTAVGHRVEEITSASVSLTANVDPGLIGGLTVQVGDRLIDGSVKGRLERLRERLLAASA
jgi:F-type H+-transporting ATPase subunit delta